MTTVYRTGFTIRKVKSGQYYIVLAGAGGRVLAQSDMFDTKGGAVEVIREIYDVVRKLGIESHADEPIEDGGPAFPVTAHHAVHTVGMTLRDWFAGQALAGLYASGPHDCDQHGMAHDAYLAADAMLKAREGVSDE